MPIHVTTTTAQTLSNKGFIGPTRFDGNVTIFGDLSCNGTQTFQNTIFSTTSAVSVVHVGSGPALWVGNDGAGDIASFYDIDANVEVLHVGGNNGTFPNVGVKTSTPNVDFTVNGAISAASIIYSLSGNSNQWNNAYSTVQTNSASWGAGGGSSGAYLPLSGGTLTGNLSANNLILSASEVPYDGITAVDVGNINFGQNVNRYFPPVVGGLSDQITLFDQAGASRNIAIGNDGLGSLWFSTYQTAFQGGFTFYNGSGNTALRIAPNSNVYLGTSGANIFDSNSNTLLSKVMQIVSVQDATPKSTTTTLALADTAPMLSAMSLYNELSATITPTRSNSTLIIDVQLPVQHTTASLAVYSLFGSTAGNSSALATIGQTAAAAYYIQSRLRYTMTAGSTSPQSFYVAFARVTGSTATVRINDGTTPYWGDTQRSTMTITEIRQ